MNTGNMSLSRERSPQRPRANTTFSSFPYGPPDYIVPVCISSMSVDLSTHELLPPMPPPGLPLPDLPNTQPNYSKGQAPQIPSQAPASTLPAQQPIVPSHLQIYDARSLLHAVHHDADLVFQKLDTIIKERDDLRIQVKSISEDYACEKLDWTAAREKYDHLNDINMAKQVILWKFIEKLQSQIPGGGKDGTESLNRATAIAHGLGSWRVTNEEVVGSPETAVSETISFTEGSTVSGVDSRGEDGTGPRLDPSAMPFVPSPTKTFSEVVSGKARQDTKAPSTYSWHDNRATANATATPVPATKFSVDTRIYGVFPSQDDKATHNFTDQEVLKYPVQDARGQDARGQDARRPFNFKSQDARRLSTTSFTKPSDNLNSKLEPADKLIFDMVLRTLPVRFSGVCPNSLIESGPCPVRGCQLSHLCEAYNENDSGCHVKGCIHIHEYRTCIEEIDGIGCTYWNAREQNKKKKRHYRFRAHEKCVTPEEWKARVVLGQLREAHREGRWLG